MRDPTVKTSREEAIKFARLFIPHSFSKHERNINAFMGDADNFECEMRLSGGAFGYVNATLYIQAYDGINLWVSTDGKIGMSSDSLYLYRQFVPDDPKLLPFKTLLREAIKQKSSGKGLSHFMNGYFKGKRTAQEMINISKLYDIKEGNAL